MANDPSMPPSEQSATTPTDNSPEMSPDMVPQPSEASPEAGNVMISMPKTAFDAMFEMVTQLAMGLETLKKTVDAGAAGAPVPSEAMPTPPTAPSAPTGDMAESDEEFLKGLAEEGNKR